MTVEEFGWELDKQGWKLYYVKEPRPHAEVTGVLYVGKAPGIKGWATARLATTEGVLEILCPPKVRERAESKLKEAVQAMESIGISKYEPHVMLWAGGYRLPAHVHRALFAYSVFRTLKGGD